MQVRKPFVDCDHVGNGASFESRRFAEDAKLAAFTAPFQVVEDGSEPVPIFGTEVGE